LGKNRKNFHFLKRILCTNLYSIEILKISNY